MNLVGKGLRAVRSILESKSPVFHSSLSQLLSNKIEAVQKKALAIILDVNYISYENALKTLNLQRLDERRDNHSLNFARKCSQSARHEGFFPLNPHRRPNSRNPRPYFEPQCNTSRYFKSSIPTMCRLLNKELCHRQTS